MSITRLTRPAVISSALCIVAVLLCISAESANAAQLINVANNAPVIGGSGDYGTGNAAGQPYNSGDSFGAGNVTNGQNSTPNNNFGSPITEPTSGDGSFWLGQQGQSTGYFVLDLGSRPAIGGFEIFNTRNGQYDDRGTGNFAIYGSNTVATATNPAMGSVLVSPTLLASGTLTAQTYPGPGVPGMTGTPGTTPLVPDEFTSLDTAGFRYIEFQALGYGAADDKIGGPSGIGLNELRIFSSPEPGSLVLLGLGAAAVVAAARRRRRA